MKSIVCETRYTWRATGFQIGTLSLPSKLKLYAEIQFKDKKKFNAFKDHLIICQKLLKKESLSVKIPKLTQ